MTKLKRLSAKLTAVQPRLAVVTSGASRAGGTSAPWRSWYKTARWERLSWSVRVEAMFICARCGKTYSDTSKLHADHVIPHRGDPALFWDRDNLQCLCVHCHASAKQREEASDR